MCDAKLYNYGQALNAASDNVVPQIVLFEEALCQGTADPSDYLTRTSTKFDQGTTSTALPAVRSLYIPSRYHKVRLTSNAGRYSLFQGPYENSDLEALVWQFDSNGDDSSTTVRNDHIVSITIESGDVDSSTQYIVDACMGETKFVGRTRLNKFVPQSEACDNFMSQTYCVKGNQDPACACLLGQTREALKLGNAQIDLPVTCTIRACNDGTAYLTKVNTEIPCSVNLCQQQITASKGVVDTSTSTIYCAGHFFNQAGGLVGVDDGAGNSVPASDPDPKPKVTKKNDDKTRTVEEVPWFTWLILAVGFFILGVLIFLFFRAARSSEETGQDTG